MRVQFPTFTNAIRISIRSVLLLGALLASSTLLAGELKVIEMFTSQGCYSCPAADKLLAKMAKNDEDILNLEFHVDYWNQLQYRSSGNWEDPYSAAEYTARQRQYSGLQLRGENGVYTPQAVINGLFGHVGSNHRALKAGLKLPNARPVSISIARDGEATLSISIKTETETAADAHIYLVNYLKEVSTNITSGENHDKVLENHNVVVDLRSIGTVAQTGDSPLQVSYAGGENRGCAVLVQRERLGEILGAARCP